MLELLRCRRGVVGLGVLLAVSCGQARESNRSPIGDLRPGGGTRILAPHQFETEMVPTRHLGEEAAQGGRSECLTGVVIHGASHPDRGWYCTVKCEFDSECPTAWRCGEIHSSLRLCTPPSDWKPRSVQPRQLEVIQ